MIDFTQISEVHIGNNEVIDISIGGVSVWSKVQGQPNDEIWYTSTDSQVVTPNNTNFGGATILSNTYTGGKGVIKFDQDVTQLGNAVFSRCATLETIIIPGAVTSLENNAFSRASNLTSVVIPNSVTTIKTYAFYSNNQLTSILIPSSVTTFQNSAIYQCINVSNLEVDANNTAYDSRNNCNAIINSTTNALVTGCKNTTIPNTVTSIETYAFYQCHGMSGMIIPNSVTSIGANAFDNADLTSVIITGDMSYGNYAFAHSGLISATVGGSISLYCFRECRNLTSVTFNSTTTSIGNKAFLGCYNLNSLTFESTTTVPTLGSNVFSSVASTGTVYGQPGLDYSTIMAALPSGWTLVIPQPNNQIWYTSTDDQVVTPYDSTAFGNATIVSNTYTNGLGVITFDQALTEIGNAFKGCTTLETVNIPNTVTSLSGGVVNGSFYDCTALTDVTMPAGLTTIHYNSFGNTTITNVYYGGTLDQWAGIDYSPNSAHLYIGGNLVTDLSALTSSATLIANYAFQGNTDITSANIPDSVTSMGVAAFMNCTSLASFTLPSTITTLPQSTFAGCTSLTTATVPSNITYIGMEAFRGCTGLTSVTMAGSLTDLQDYAFNGCTSLASITFSGSTVPTIYTSTFLNIASTGTVYGQAGLDYSTVMAALPSGWTLVQ